VCFFVIDDEDGGEVLGHDEASLKSPAPSRRILFSTSGSTTETLVPCPSRLSMSDLATVLANDAAHDEQAKAGAGFAGGEERLEQIAHVLAAACLCR